MRLVELVAFLRLGKLGETGGRCFSEFGETCKKSRLSVFKA